MAVAQEFVVFLEMLTHTVKPTLGWLVPRA